MRFDGTWEVEEGEREEVDSIISGSSVAGLAGDPLILSLLGHRGAGLREPQNGKTTLAKSSLASGTRRQLGGLLERHPCPSLR